MLANSLASFVLHSIACSFAAGNLLVGPVGGFGCARVVVWLLIIWSVMMKFVIKAGANDTKTISAPSSRAAISIAQNLTHSIMRISCDGVIYEYSAPADGVVDVEVDYSVNLRPISEAIRCARMHGDNTLIAELCNLMDDITMERFKALERQLWHVMDSLALDDLRDWVAEITTQPV